MVEKTNKRLFNSSLSILEIGAGDGFILKFLKGKGHRVLGVDISERAAAIMKKNGIPAKRIDILNERILTDEKFDLVLLMSILEHIPEAENFFQRSYEYTKKYMFVAIPNTGYWVK